MAGNRQGLNRALSSIPESPRSIALAVGSSAVLPVAQQPQCPAFLDKDPAPADEHKHSVPNTPISSRRSVAASAPASHVSITVARSKSVARLGQDEINRIINEAEELRLREVKPHLKKYAVTNTVLELSGGVAAGAALAGAASLAPLLSKKSPNLFELGGYMVAGAILVMLLRLAAIFPHRHHHSAKMEQSLKNDYKARADYYILLREIVNYLSTIDLRYYMHDANTLIHLTNLIQQISFLFEKNNIDDRNNLFKSHAAELYSEIIGTNENDVSDKLEKIKLLSQALERNEDSMRQISKSKSVNLQRASSSEVKDVEEDETNKTPGGCARVADVASRGIDAISGLVALGTLIASMFGEHEDEQHRGIIIPLAICIVFSFCVAGVRIVNDKKLRTITHNEDKTDADTIRTVHARDNANTAHNLLVDSRSVCDEQILQEVQARKLREQESLRQKILSDEALGQEENLTSQGLVIQAQALIESGNADPKALLRILDKVKLLLKAESAVRDEAAALAAKEHVLDVDVLSPRRVTTPSSARGHGCVSPLTLVEVKDEDIAAVAAHAEDTPRRVTAAVASPQHHFYTPRASVSRADIASSNSTTPRRKLGGQ